MKKIAYTLLLSASVLIGFNDLNATSLDVQTEFTSSQNATAKLVTQDKLFERDSLPLNNSFGFASGSSRKETFVGTYYPEEVIAINLVLVNYLSPTCGGQLDGVVRFAEELLNKPKTLNFKINIIGVENTDIVLNAVEKAMKNVMKDIPEETKQEKYETYKKLGFSFIADPSKQILSIVDKELFNENLLYKHQQYQSEVPHRALFITKGSQLLWGTKEKADGETTLTSFYSKPTDQFIAKIKELGVGSEVFK